MGRLQDGTGLTTGPIRDRDDNINVTKRNYMNNDNYSLLNDIYLIVSSTDFKRTPELLEFLEQQMDMERDVWDIDDLHDPEFKLRSHLNG